MGARGGVWLRRGEFEVSDRIDDLPHLLRRRQRHPILIHRLTLFFLFPIKILVRLLVLLVVVLLLMLLLLLGVVGDLLAVQCDADA